MSPSRQTEIAQSGSRSGSKSNGYMTRVLSESEYAKWNKFVATSDSGSIYSTPEYLDILCSTAGGSFKILACLKGEEFAGGVGLYENSTAFGKCVSNRLLLYYNGLVLAKSKSSHPYQDTSKSIKIMSVLEEALSSFGYGRVLLHCRSAVADVRVFTSAGWHATPSYTYVVPIADLEALKSRMEQNQRRLISRCEGAEITVSCDDDFESFYRLHNEIHMRKDAPLYLPHGRFKTYFERLKELGLCRLFHARTKEGQSVAAQLVLHNEHPVTHTVTAAADHEYLNIGATPFLRWKVFEDLSRSGYIANDLTDAALNPVTRFKGQLGGNLETTFVLTSLDTFGYRFGEGLRGMYHKGRGAVGKLVRSVTNRGDE